MARLSHADQSRLPVPRLHPCRADRARPRIISRLGEALFRVARPGHSRVAQLLLQVSDDRSGPVSRARPLHSIDEAQEHSASPQRRGVDHPSGPGILRLITWRGGRRPRQHQLNLRWRWTRVVSTTFAHAQIRGLSNVTAPDKRRPFPCAVETEEFRVLFLFAVMRSAHPSNVSL